MPHIPDLVIHQIIRQLPTKAAVRMSLLSKQWEDVLSSVPVLDFDEFGDQHPHNFDFQQQQHEEYFINNILKNYLELYERDEHKQLLEKLRLRMMYYSSADTAIVNELLSNSLERGVKDLEMSLRVDESLWGMFGVNSYYYFCLSPKTLANAKSITTLKLEYMRLEEKNLQCDDIKLPNSRAPLLPSLKTMSLKNVHFNYLHNLFRECPSIEHLSFISCSFDKREDGDEVLVFTTSLKSLEMKHCKAWSNIHVHDEAGTLESFTFVSSKMSGILLCKTNNLRRINIHSQHLKDFFVYGCHSSVKATINTPDLLRFFFYGYFMKSKLSLRAPQLSSAQIVLREIWDTKELTNDWSWEHFSALRGFLKEFGSCVFMDLFTRDLKALTFPEDFKRTFSSSEIALPNVALLTIAMPDHPTLGDVPNDFRKSSIWMAPISWLKYINRLEYQSYMYWPVIEH